MNLLRNIAEFLFPSIAIRRLHREHSQLHREWAAYQRLGKRLDSIEGLSRLDNYKTRRAFLQASSFISEVTNK